MLDLAPTLEREFVDRVRATGMTENEYFAKLLAAENPQATAWHLPDLSGDQQQYAKVLAYINAPAEEITVLHAAEIARFDAELTEAAQATPEETSAANAEWEALKQRMNAHRASSGARLLFAEPAPAGGA